MKTQKAPRHPVYPAAVALTGGFCFKEDDF